MAKPEDVEQPEAGEDQPQMSVAEQLRVQTELALHEEEARRTKAPAGRNRQIMVVMRHGERIDEVCRKQQASKLPLICKFCGRQHNAKCGVLQVDKEWSAIAPRPFDPFLSEHGEDQVQHAVDQLQLINYMCEDMLSCMLYAGQEGCSKVEEV